MKKFLFLTSLFLWIGFSGFSQTSLLTGIIIDKKSKEPLIGASVTLESSNVLKVTTSDVDGSFKFDHMVPGNYQIKFSYIGYHPLIQNLQVQNEPINMGMIALKEGVDLKEINIVEDVLPVIQLEDTMQFNADSYKTLPDADAADLIEKMPTVVVNDGTIQAQGEDVKQVLVDGKPFFGNDPNAALSNLPVEVIDKIQIYDQVSDQARFTGFDDGQTTKTINIITKSNVRSGQFGKVYGGYGYEDKYQAGGNINIFNGDQRISVIGLSNNINQQNFSTEDLLGVVGTSEGRGGRRGGRRGPPGRNEGVSAEDFTVSQSGGITSSNALGINFSDKWGDKLDVSASYFFNQSDNVTEQSLTQQYFDEFGLDDMYSEESLSESTNINHKINGVFDYKLNDNNSFILRSKTTWQGNSGMENVIGQTIFNNTILNQTNNEYQAELNGLNLENSLLWRHRFAKRGRTFSIDFRNEYAPSDGNSYLLSDNIYSNDSTFLDQTSTLDNNQWKLSANVRYTEPISNNGQVMVDYEAGYQQEKSNKETFDFDDDLDNYSLFNSDLSNVFSSAYLTNSLGTGYRYRSGDWRWMVRANTQWAGLITEQSFPYESDTENDFFNILPMAMISYRKSRTEDFRLMYRTSTDLPSISQLQNVVDNSNPLQLTVGNPNLIQAYQHQLRGKYSMTNTEKSSVFFAMLSGVYANDYIASSTYFSAADYDSSYEDEAQLTIPVNLDGYYSLQSFVTYGFPVKYLKSNLNVDLSASYSHAPGLINESINYANNSSVGIGLTLSSNFSERVDFTVSSRSNFNAVNNTLQTESNTNYLNQKTRLKMNWIFYKNFVFRTDITHDFYEGLSDSFDSKYFLWNLSIGKKFLKNDRAEISLTVFDLLNQNNAITRNVTEVYTEDVQTNVLQRYAMISFKYDIRHFKIK